MNEALNISVRPQTGEFCPGISAVDLTDCGSRSAPAFCRKEEIETDFFANDVLACCGEELKPSWTDDGRFLSMCGRCGQKYTDRTQVRFAASPWIGVDLDGTLAHDLGNKRLNEIGSPVKPMVNRVKKWVAEGKTVKIFTARASSQRQVAAIKKWLIQNQLPALEVTNTKDLHMVELWDDRCVQVTTNSGEPTNELPIKKMAAYSRADVGRQASRLGLVHRLKILLALNL